jgi:hypothetical protein
MKTSRDDVEDAMQSGEPVQEIGVAEYYVAQRAARKMVEFLRIQQSKKAQEKLLKQSMRELDPLLAGTEVPPSSGAATLKATPLDAKGRAAGATADRDKKITRIESIEEASSDSDGNHEDKVKKFLKQL